MKTMNSILCVIFIAGLIIGVGISSLYYAFLPNDVSVGRINIGTIEFGEEWDLVYAQARCGHDGSDYWDLRIMDASGLELYKMYRVVVWKRDIIIAVIGVIG